MSLMILFKWKRYIKNAKLKKKSGLIKKKKTKLGEKKTGFKNSSHNNNRGNGRKLWEVMDVSMVMVVGFIGVFLSPNSPNYIL